MGKRVKERGGDGGGKRDENGKQREEGVRRRGGEWEKGRG